jgi:SulP family sulfate permease
MTGSSPQVRLSAREQFLPKLVTVLREGYHAADLRSDLTAGLTVAIVALPLSMAIAIASGVGPERGLYTAIVGGFLVSLLGGSRFQVGGPAGAFIVLVAACVAQIGIPGLILATFLSGVFLVCVGALRLGSYIKFIPYPVTVGFTAGIGVIIFASQMTGLFGLTLAGSEPGPIVEKVAALWAARGTVNPAAVAVALATIAGIEAVKRWRPRWPSLLIAVAGVTVAAAVLGLPVETIGTRFGELPRSLPVPALPAFDPGLIIAALPYAISFTLLGAIESLLSAVVADGMSDGHHRSNAELVAQGVANMGAAIFGGFCVTGTIARTATNVRAGARGPLAGMFHALFLLVFMLVAAPLAVHIPLAALAGVLAIVAWNMIEKDEFLSLLRISRGDAVVLLVTFLLVVFRDLTEGIVVGFALGGLLFIHRMSEVARVEERAPLVAPDIADQVRTHAGPDTDEVMVYRIKGAFFFGAVTAVGGILDRIARVPKAMVVDFSEVPFVDSSAARTMDLFIEKMARQGCKVYVTGTDAAMRRVLFVAGVRPPRVRFMADVATAVARAAEAVGDAEGKLTRAE